MSLPRDAGVILVTTAGKVGAEAARLLAADGAAVRVLVRDPDKAAMLGDVGVQLAEGDLDDLSSVDAAMAGVDRVVLVSPAVPQQELAVIDSAARHGVEHVVKATSKASPDSPIARQRGQAQIEAALAASGLGHTLLRSNFYMQNFLMLAPGISATRAFSSSAGDGEVGFVDARDVAAVAAAVVRSPRDHATASYELTGPELLSYGDVAAVLSDVLGHPIAYHPRSRAEDAQEMVDAGLPPQVAAMNAHAVSLIADGDAAWITDDVATVLGRPPRSFRRFALDNAAAFADVVLSATQRGSLSERR